MPEKVKGFSQTHVSGTGGGQKYGNVLIQPMKHHDTPTQTRLLLPDGRLSAVPVYASSRTSEDIRLGYYACTYDNGISTEITTSARSAVYRFKGAEALLVDAASFLGMDTIPNKREAQQFVGCLLKVTGKREISGWTSVRGGWNNGDAYTVYFCLQTDKPLKGIMRRDAEGRWLVAELAGKECEVKVGISYISVDQARSNITKLGFDQQYQVLQREWEQQLARVPYQGTTKEMRMFYTALYHTLLMPVDKTGENPKWQGGDYYDDYYALWDTYRTSFPLLMDYYPERAAGMVNALLNIYRHEGYMPDARSGDCNGRTQGGSHGEVVIADAFARGLQGIDYHLALEAMLKDAEVPPLDHEKEGRGGLQEYIRLGYVPYGIPRAGTRTVEYSYDDWCIAQVARGLGREDLYEKYMVRSANWRNLWRGDYEWQGMRGFIMPRDAAGHWLDSVPWGKSKVFHPHIPYLPDTKVAPWHIAWWDTFFYEALSAEYSLSIPHDVEGLIGLCGGDSAFRRRLDIFFENKHYNVGNEPSFLTPYLYAYIGRTDLASKRVAEIVNTFFDDTPDGLPGNDDSGAMSAWLIWAMLGRYPATPGASLGLGHRPVPQYIHISPVRIDEGTKTGEDRSVKVEHKAEPHETPDFKVNYTLNRQYRSWDVVFSETSGRSSMSDDTVIVKLHGNTLYIPRAVADHASGFAWDNVYREGTVIHCRGTFLFISHDALRQLKGQHSFVYDGITWREQCRDDEAIHVKAEIDGTEMWISLKHPLPLVLKMKGNPLGIDWTLSHFTP